VRKEEECVCSACLLCCNILISGKIIKEMPGSVVSGTHCINNYATDAFMTGELQIHHLSVCSM
jgi:hypothetical protein